MRVFGRMESFEKKEKERMKLRGRREEKGMERVELRKKGRKKVGKKRKTWGKNR
jgi:hypothetical protein